MLCENCGEKVPNNIIYECPDCFNPICENCANVCKNCGGYFCDGCYRDHKKKCK